jgi:hypothetical protein
LLEYRVLIHIARVEEFMTLEGPVWTNSPGSDQSGLPSHGSMDGEGSFWTSRNLSWVSGVPQWRGGGGHGGGADMVLREVLVAVRLGAPHRPIGGFLESMVLFTF